MMLLMRDAKSYFFWLECLLCHSQKTTCVCVFGFLPSCFFVCVRVSLFVFVCLCVCVFVVVYLDPIECELDRIGSELDRIESELDRIESELDLNCF